MKKAVVIDQAKIDLIKKKIKTNAYMNRAINRLAYEISAIYF